MSEKQFPAKRQSKKAKNVAAPEQAVATEKLEPKPKGPIPSYQPNKAREAARLMQESGRSRALAEQACKDEAIRMQAELEHMRSFYGNMVAGIHGEYTVGDIDETGQLVYYMYRVETLRLEATETMAATDILVIIGYRDIYILLSWLFKPAEQINLLSGWRGEIQEQMLNFLREHLAHEIDFAKAERTRNASKHNGGPQLVTSNGQAVKPTHDTKTLKPIKVFTSNTIGRFSFSGGQGSQCVVVQEPIDGKMTITVVSLTEEHPLAKNGVRTGLWIYSEDLGAGIPDAAHELGDEYFTHANLLRDHILAKLDKLSKSEHKSTEMVAA